jgi:hypothetical protein
MGETGEGLDPMRWPAAVVGSSEQWHDKVGSWVGEMADEVGDPFGAAGRRGAHQ